MRLRSILLGSAFAVACGGAAHAGQPNGWYLGLEGGANWIEDWNQTTILIGPAVATFDTGWLALGTVGYKWQNNFRVEFEAGYRHNTMDTLTDLPDPTPDPIADTDVWEATAMANVLYDLAVTNNVSVSIGAGAGGDFSNLSLSSFEADEWNFAYQGIAGLNYSIGRQTALFLNYRYLRVLSPEFEVASTPIIVNSDDFVKHAVTLGLRYALQSTPSYVDTAPPPPAPSSSAPPRQFIVFFGFNKYNLTSEALRVISEAVVAAKETGSASILITGHTDTVGSNGYNERLSMRRSNAVKGEMVRQGISTSSINANGRGETELLVQTADGVKEPQNRRAAIDLN
ncbi:MAG: OmpA family protein [Micropepsaceae bacterium]